MLRGIGDTIREITLKKGFLMIIEGEEMFIKSSFSLELIINPHEDALKFTLCKCITHGLSIINL